MNKLINANVSVLDQLSTFLNCCNDEIYTAILPQSPSSIGKHIRHILDHYHCIQQSFSTHVINYNDRHRGSSIEHDKRLALQSALNVQSWLQNTKPQGATVDILSDIQSGHSQAMKLESTLERELLYLINHSVHHLAFAALLAKLQGLEVPDFIGLAPATHNFNNRTKEQDYENYSA